MSRSDTPASHRSHQANCNGAGHTTGKLEHYQIAAALDTPIQFFFRDEDGLSDDVATSFHLLQDRETVALLKAFSQIRSRVIRRALLAHAQALASCGADQVDTVSRIEDDGAQ